MFAPGQFNMLYVFGIGEMPISIWAEPAQRDRSALRSRRRNGERKQLRGPAGRMLGVRGPFGSSWPLRGKRRRCRDRRRRHRPCAVAPAHPPAARASGTSPARGHALRRRRAPEDALQARNRALAERRTGHRRDRRIVQPDWPVTWALSRSFVDCAAFDPDNTVAMVCGPEVMMRSPSLDTAERGVPDERIYISMERNMKCAIGLCGHCQFGPNSSAKRPGFSLRRVEKWLRSGSCDRACANPSSPYGSSPRATAAS